MMTVGGATVIAATTLWLLHRLVHRVCARRDQRTAELRWTRLRLEVHLEAAYRRHKILRAAAKAKAKADKLTKEYRRLA